MDFVKLENINKRYTVNNEKINALNNINLSIEQGELLAVMGRSGSGKSTLINIIAGLCYPNSGALLFQDKNIYNFANKDLLLYRRENIGLIVQNYALLENESVFNNVSLPLKLRKVSNKNILSIVNNILDSFNIREKSNIPIYKLSGGEKQRVAISRAICYKPKILLADEPTAALDRISEQEIMDWLLKINKDGTTVIIVTHDNEISQCCHRTIFLDKGTIIKD